MTQQNKSSNYGDDIATTMVNKINGLTLGLKNYQIRELVEDTEKLGKELVRKQLKTNQIRKFLDAINRLKANLATNEKKDFSVIETDLIFLQPKLAYAAARQQKDSRDPGPVAPFKRVLEAAIKKVNTTEDFDRLVQLVEAVIAYHKAAGGKDQ